jgi:hypothetical protein
MSPGPQKGLLGRSLGEAHIGMRKTEKPGSLSSYQNSIPKQTGGPGSFLPPAGPQPLLRILICLEMVMNTTVCQGV